MLDDEFVLLFGILLCKRVYLFDIFVWKVERKGCKIVREERRKWWGDIDSEDEGDRVKR